MHAHGLGVGGNAKGRRGNEGDGNEGEGKRGRMGLNLQIYYNPAPPLVTGTICAAK